MNSVYDSKPGKNFLDELFMEDNVNENDETKVTSSNPINSSNLLLRKELKSNTTKEESQTNELFKLHKEKKKGFRTQKLNAEMLKAFQIAEELVIPEEEENNIL